MATLDTEIDIEKEVKIPTVASVRSLPGSPHMLLERPKTCLRRFRRTASNRSILTKKKKELVNHYAPESLTQLIKRLS